MSALSGPNTRYLIPALLILLGYLLGSLLSAYWIGQWVGGKDLRDYGSGALGGSMVYEHVGRRWVVPVVVFDVLKATVPAALALWLDQGYGVAAAAGLAAAVGHNWSIWHRFHGGRGMGTFAGVWLAVYWPGVLWMIGWIGLGWRLGDSAPWLFVSLITLPILSWLTGGPDAVAPLAGAMILVTLLKRLEANRRPLPPPGPQRRRVILLRLLLDRDLAAHNEWIRQQPDEKREG